MYKIILRTSAIIGLIVGTSTIAAASPATNLLDRGTTQQATSVERVDYYWNHHRYHHRSWDRGHRRWRYYN